MKTTKPYNVSFTDEDLRMLKKLEEHYREQRSGVIRRCISFTHQMIYMAKKSMGEEE